ncbi:ABC transporter substrate-binding protein [Brachybacterium squillarum]|uniref:ABC transporter substrate-binding protein n=1 Tax=Brachybacterium squillarum TaxID=661979 RepID=UPI00222192E6|nr:extracellular solute-binding protein [Brachybacterium squillarum]MCW1805142.1 extracellular solute-binding protein [Brachybacterium squillarum]
MKRKQFLALAAGAASLPLVAACGGSSGGAASTAAAVEGDVEPRAISWLLSRPANGPVIEIMTALAEEYAKDHEGFSLKLITTPDRPSYIQKYETLAAANELPELFDTDATPFAAKLNTAGRMIDVEDLLTELGVIDDFRPAALDYQRFDDGSLRMIPLEFGVEVFWYNKGLFEKAGVEVPTTLDEFVPVCEALAAAGVTPIAVGGQDAWPLERYVAYQPFRIAGPDYVTELKKGKAAFADEPGKASATWLSDLGKAGAFQKGFSSVGYADAQALFTSGKAAIYNMGTWELPNLATAALPEAMRDQIGFFTLPVTDGSVTGADEFVSPSGIGVAINATTYDPLVRDFLAFVLERYPAEYAKSGLLGPTGIDPVVPEDALPIYQEAIDVAAELGEATLMPWDTQLDPSTNSRLQQELVLLVQGDVTAEEFLSTMDEALTKNAPKYFED